MSNVAGKAYVMTVITPMRPWLTWIQRLVYMAIRAAPSTMRSLLGLTFIHFARWAIVKRKQWPNYGQGRQNLQNDYLLFSSNFNGTWDQYLDSFSDGIPTGVDAFWISTTKFPHSIPSTPFKDYIRVNQIDTDYYYNATPGAAQTDVKAALRVRRAILTLAQQSDSQTPEEFRTAYIAAFCAVQNDLGYQGYAPVASDDTKNADSNREDYVNNQKKAAAALI
jgi:hypothetical protein